MVFNSIEFLIFFPIVLLIYYIFPNKVRYLWLLFSSYYFYMCWNAKYAILLFTSTAITYLSGILLEKVKATEKIVSKTFYMKGIVVICFLLNLGILIYFKYANWGFQILAKLFSYTNIELNVPAIDVLLPVGISFYTFQALGYTMDVYRNDIYAEKNFFRYALFVSFFPQLVAGPIERSKNLLKQLAVPKKFDFEYAKEGVFLMIWGYFLKVVLGDRIAIFVDSVYGDIELYPGFFLVVASMLFAIQIYCDFAGYSIIAIGTAKILGINLMQNFNAPYLSTSVAEFWRNWHISLTSWFKDYLYVPLGGSRKGTLRKYINKMIVFLVSGLWHGASLSYVVWGGINGFYQIIGEILRPIRDKVIKFLGLHRESFGHRIINIAGTFILVDFAWIFFRAEGIKQALLVIKSIITVYNPWILFDGSLYNCGLNQKNFNLMLIGIVILTVMDIFKKKKISVIEKIKAQDAWFQVCLIAMSVVLIVLFGIWGGGYDATGFIYFQF